MTEIWTPYFTITFAVLGELTNFSPACPSSANSASAFCAFFSLYNEEKRALEVQQILLQHQPLTQPGSRARCRSPRESAGSQRRESHSSDRAHRATRRNRRPLAPLEKANGLAGARKRHARERVSRRIYDARRYRMTPPTGNRPAPGRM